MFISHACTSWPCNSKTFLNRYYLSKFRLNLSKFRLGNHCSLSKRAEFSIIVCDTARVFIERHRNSYHVCFSKFTVYYLCDLLWYNEKSFDFFRMCKRHIILLSSRVLVEWSNSMLFTVKVLVRVNYMHRIKVKVFSIKCVCLTYKRILCLSYFIWYVFLEINILYF